MALACSSLHMVMVVVVGSVVLARSILDRRQLGVGTCKLSKLLEGAHIVMVAAGENHSTASTSKGEVLPGAMAGTASQGMVIKRT